MTEKSRKPSILMARVLGMGVAVKVKMSVSALKDFNASLCLTPNRCSSSTIINPRSLNLSSFDSNL